MSLLELSDHNLVGRLHVEVFEVFRLRLAFGLVVLGERNFSRVSGHAHLTTKLHELGAKGPVLILELVDLNKVFLLLDYLQLELVLKVALELQLFLRQHRGNSLVVIE